MTGIGMLARAAVRRGWRTMVLLGVLAGLGLGVALATVQTARRTSTAYARLERASGAPDLVALWIADPETTPVPDLAGVRRHWDAVFTVGELDTDEQVFLSVAAGPRGDRGLRPSLVVRGRDTDPRAVDEVVLTEDFARVSGLDVGDVLPIAFLTAAEVTQFDSGFGEPDGPHLDLRVVGVVRSVLAGGDNAPGAYGTPAFHRELTAAGATYPATFVDLHGGAAAVSAFERRLEAAGRRAEPTAGAEEFTAFITTVPSAARAGYALTARVLVTGLLVLGGVAGAAALLAAALALRRHFLLVASPESATLTALGVSRRQLWLARVTAAGTFVGAATVAVLVVAVATGSIGPLGSLGRLEPRPGFRLNVGLLALGVVGALAVLGVAVAIATRPARRRAHTGVARSSRVGEGLATAGAPPEVVIGVRLALAPRRGRGVAPLRAVLLATAVVLAGLMGVLMFSASLDRLRDAPARWGWNADFVALDMNDESLRDLRSHPLVHSVADVRDFQVRIEGRTASGGTIDRPRIGWTVLDGRAPTAAGEVMLGARLARALDRGVGDQVTFRGADGDRLSLVVVGVGTSPRTLDGFFGGGLQVSRADAPRVALTQEERNAIVALRPDVDPDRARRAIGARYELMAAQRPPDVQNLSELGRLPVLLAAFLALLAVAVLGHSVVTATHRGRRELDTLRAVGFVRRQARLVVVTASLVTVAAALVVGVAGGVLVGGAAWRFTARSAYVATDLAPFAGRLALASLAALLVALVVALVPAWRVTRQPPAAGLRTE